MFKKTKLFVFSNLALILTFIAGTGLGTNCWWTSYEPDVPACLKR